MDTPALNGVTPFNYTGIDEVVARLIAMTDGERRQVAAKLIIAKIAAMDMPTVRQTKGKTMIKLMNSAMMPQPGKYEMVSIERDVFVGILRDEGECDSYVGYPQTAEFVERISGVKVAVSRRQTLLVDGDRFLVVKRAYRLPDATTKGAPVDEADYEFYLVWYSV